MKVFLTGGTGYVGRQIVRDLVRENHSVTALVRKGSQQKLPSGIEEKIQIVYGDIQLPQTYRDALKNAEAIINLPGLLREFPRKGITFERVHFLGTKILADEAKTAGVMRFIQMSALGVRADATTKYQETKFRAEEYLKGSGLQWTIFRPSLMFGNEKEGIVNFMSVLNDLLEMIPFFVPVLGDGKYRFQPIAVQNISAGFVKALTLPASIGKTYDAAGPDRYTYNELLDMIQHVTGKYKTRLHQPMVIMKILASFFDGIPGFPVSRGQITMLLEENISDNWTEFFSD